MIVIPPQDPRPLRGAPCAFLDFESTGPDPRTALPVQVAVVHCELGDAAPRVVYASLIDPGVPIPPESTAVHRITDAMVEGAPRWPEAVRAVLDAIRGRVLGAFNLPYDWQILARGAADIGLAPADLPFGALDPLVWAKTVHRFEKSKRLVDVCGRYGIEVDAHDASADALATAQLAPKLLHDLGRHRECGAEPLRSVAGIWAWTVAAAVRDDASYAAWCARNGRPAPSSSWRELTASGGSAP
jgi:DNA polymerase-3 subunit epsilon